MTQVLNIKDNEVDSTEVLPAQAEVLWSISKEALHTMVQSGWLVMTIDIDIEACTYGDVLQHLTNGVIFFR